MEIRGLGLNEDMPMVSASTWKDSGSVVERG